MLQSMGLQSQIQLSNKTDLPIQKFSLTEVEWGEEEEVGRQVKGLKVMRVVSWGYMRNSQTMHLQTVLYEVLELRQRFGMDIQIWEVQNVGDR